MWLFSSIGTFHVSSVEYPGTMEISGQQRITSTYLYNEYTIYIRKRELCRVCIIFFISAQKIDFGYSSESLHRGGSNEHIQSTFGALIRKILSNNVFMDPWYITFMDPWYVPFYWKGNGIECYLFITWFLAAVHGRTTWTACKTTHCLLVVIWVPQFAHLPKWLIPFKYL